MDHKAIFGLEIGNDGLGQMWLNVCNKFKLRI